MLSSTRCSMVRLETVYGMVWNYGLWNVEDEELESK